MDACDVHSSFYTTVVRISCSRDPELTRDGKILAQETPAPGPFDVIVVSPLLRTLQTAAYHLCGGPENGFQVPHGAVMWLVPDYAERLIKPLHEENLGSTLEESSNRSTSAGLMIRQRAAPNSTGLNYPPDVPDD